MRTITRLCCVDLFCSAFDGDVLAATAPLVIETAADLLGNNQYPERPTVVLKREARTNMGELTFDKGPSPSDRRSAFFISPLAAEPFTVVDRVRKVAGEFCAQPGRFPTVNDQHLADPSPRVCWVPPANGAT